ncbi:hypothetical protein ACTQ33_08430 [Candidatus Avoscillospira sp. LCP25S3_F1]|uniref:hypothetical protein n=1 Tax=Candidatus Avoscillospira sp. LCP25S3_F1 TaxID=3438825 RepID=UPI003F9333FE
MRGSELLDKLSLVDIVYVEAAAIPRQPVRPNHRWAAVAACIALLAAVGGLWLGQVPTPGQPVPPNGTESGLPPVTIPDAEDTQSETTEDVERPASVWDFYYNEIDHMVDAARQYSPGYFQEALDQTELDAVQPGMWLEWMTFSGEAGFDGEGNLLEVVLWVTTSQPDTTVTVTLSPDGPSPCFLLPEEAVPSTCNGVEYRLGRWVDPSGGISLRAESQMHGIWFTLSLHTTADAKKQAQADFEDILECFTFYEQGMPNLSAVTAVEIPPWQDKNLSQTEALADPDFGAWFLPTAPSGFAEESICRYQDQNTNALWGLWTSEYGQLRWEVRYMTTEDADYLVDISEPETYDLSRYPIPRADSVPEYLRKMVEHPIFEAEELTWEVLSTRADTAADAGDSDGARMNFGVRYGDIIVEVQSKSVDPQWIYKQLMVLQP